MEIYMAFLRLLLSSSLIFTAFINRNVIADDFHDAITPCLSNNIVPVNYYDVKLNLYCNDNNNHKNNDKNKSSYDISFIRSHIERQQMNNNLIFDGKVSILINITYSTHNIKLRLRQSQINLVTVKLRKASIENYEIQPLRYSYNYNMQELSLYYQDELKKGLYVLKTNFEGTIGKDFTGLSATSYTILKDIKWVITSEFQTIMKKLIFPCLDQPKLKVNFNISIFQDRYTAFTNLENPNHIIFRIGKSWRYHISPVSSNYFVLYGIFSDFTKHTAFGETIILYCRTQVHMFLKAMSNSIEEIPNKLKTNWYIIEDEKNQRKTHFVIPGFRENNFKIRGLLLYSEVDVMYSEGFEHSAREIRIAQLVTQKLLRHYFSDTSSQLINGFFTLLEAHIINEYLPQFRMLDLFVVQKQHESLHLDYYFNVQVLEDKSSKTNSSPHYNKVPFLLRMLQYLITHEVFREGFHKYINKHASDSTTVSNNLWIAMQDVLHEKFNLSAEYEKNINNLTYLMNSWLKQKHYPIVTIKRNVNSTVSMQLENYIPNDIRNILMVPVTFASQSDPNFDHTSYKDVQWLSCASKNWPIVKLPQYFKENDWIIANLKQVGYYRVNYDSENWDKIANYLNSPEYTKIHVLNRAQIIDDSFHFAIQGLQNYSLLWKISSYLWQETDYIAWYPMFKALEYISSIFPFENEERVQNIKNILNKIFDDLITKIYRNNLGYIKMIIYDTDSEFTKYLKEEIAKWACVLNNTLCLIQANNIMREHVQTYEAHNLPMFLRQKEWIFCQGLKLANIFEFQRTSRLLNKYSEIITLLSCVRDVPLGELFKFVNLLRYYDHENMIHKIVLFYSIIEKHVRNPNVLDFILLKFYNIKLSEISTEAALIVIINNIYSDKETKKIIQFVLHIDNQLLKYIIITKVHLRESQIKNQRNYVLRLK